MPARSEPILYGSTYHIYNRGVNKTPIFFSPRNYQYFLFKMGHYLDKKASIYAYCLMPNHFHLLVKVECENFTLSGLQPFLGAYTKAVNNEQDRIGPLFQGRFQANLIGNDEQLLECVRYIHLNPVEAGLARSPSDWEFSSYRSYFTTTDSTFVNTGYVMQFFENLSEFAGFSQSGSNRPDVFEDYD